jgi:hypothetical protein
MCSANRKPVTTYCHIALPRKLKLTSWTETLSVHLSEAMTFVSCDVVFLAYDRANRINLVLNSFDSITQGGGGGTRWRIWLKHCATSRKVAGSIPGGVIGIDIIFSTALCP